MLGQFSREYLQLYPTAKVLVAGREDVSPARRRDLVARRATDDWDAVIITQSSFERIPLSAETEAAFVAAEIAELHESSAVSYQDGKGLSVKALEKALARAEERQTRLLADERCDEGGVSFEGTGIDYLTVDEALAYKGQAVVSHIPSVRSDGSKRAEDLAAKIEWAAFQPGRSGGHLRDRDPQQHLGDVCSAALPATRDARPHRRRPFRRVGSQLRADGHLLGTGSRLEALRDAHPFGSLRERSRAAAHVPGSDRPGSPTAAGWGRRLRSGRARRYEVSSR